MSMDNQALDAIQQLARVVNLPWEAGTPAHGPGVITDTHPTGFVLRTWSMHPHKAEVATYVVLVANTAPSLVEELQRTREQRDTIAAAARAVLDRFDIQVKSERILAEVDPHALWNDEMRALDRVLVAIAANMRGHGD